MLKIKKTLAILERLLSTLTVLAQYMYDPYVDMLPACPADNLARLSLMIPPCNGPHPGH